MTTSSDSNRDDLIVITGAGGAIGGALARYFHDKGFARIRAVDKKPLGQWYQRVPGVECLCLDVSVEENCRRACEGATEVYNLAADMGGMGFIERFRIECLRSILINTHMLEAAWQAGAQRYFYSSSACIYPEGIQQDTDSAALREADAYPAQPDSDYGWEKLFSERLYLAYGRNHGIEVRIARFHNVFGPEGDWSGGREKAPAAICRKVAGAEDGGAIEIWGDGEQTRTFLYIDECLDGVSRLMASAFTGPVNIGSDELISINDLARMTAEIAGKRLRLRHVSGPLGVRGRRSDNTRIAERLGWRPTRPLREGMERTYRWIEAQVRRKT